MGYAHWPSVPASRLEGNVERVTSLESVANILSASGALDPQGPVAKAIADLWWIMLAMSAVVFVAFLAAFGYALFRRRADDDDTAPKTNRWIIAGGVVMPSIVLTAVYALTLSAMSSVDPDLPPDPVVVEVVGHQWWWEIGYEGHDFTTANELQIPVGEPVEIRLTSSDVIHSFWVPALGGKIDALPDTVNSLILQADEPGDYRGQCAEFCGLQHAKMGLLVVATSRAEFDRWLADQSMPAGSPDDPLAREGEAIFLSAGCPECHTIRGTRASGEEGPDLTHIASRQTLAATTLPNTPAHLSNWIEDPQAFKEGTQMVTSPLSDDEIEALTAYLMVLR